MDYTAVTAGIRNTKVEGFLADLSVELRGKLQAKAKMVDLSAAGVVASDAEYEALVQATKIFISNVK